MSRRVEKLEKKAHQEKNKIFKKNVHVHDKYKVCTHELLNYIYLYI